MTQWEQWNQAYISWYLGMAAPQTSWGSREIRPQDIVPMRKPKVFTNPWELRGPARFWNANNFASFDRL